MDSHVGWLIKIVHTPQNINQTQIQDPNKVTPFLCFVIQMPPPPPVFRSALWTQRRIEKSQLLDLLHVC